MITQRPAPFTEKLVEKDGTSTKAWHRFWMDLKKVDDLQATRVSGGNENNFVSLDADGDIADSGKVRPSGDVVGTNDTQTLTNKTLGSKHQDNLTDKTADEDITGRWKFPKKRFVVYTTTPVNLTSADFGKIVKIDNGSAPFDVYLPSVDASDIGSWVNIMRKGTGILTIHAADSDKIETSSPGGSITNDESNRKVANIDLILMDEDQWGIWNTGIWKTA